MKNKLKVLLIGGGGREHAIADSLLSSPDLRELVVYPGNGGFDQKLILSSTQISITDKTKFLLYIELANIDFVIVGPEDPLVSGMADWCREVGVPCFGPSAYCAQIEGSKEFAKAMMTKAKVPTAEYSVFSDHQSAWTYCQSRSLPLVVKADGLAAGKGVTVAFQLDEVKQALDGIFIEQKFGASGAKVVIESFLEGGEASLFVITDGSNYQCLPAAQDHKRAFDGDLGPNTGGMGAYAPAPIVTPTILKNIQSKIIEPILSEFRNVGHPYTGLLYVGLMISKDGSPNVVEFNCRFGDPETQCVLRLLDEDLLSLLFHAATSSVESRDLKIKPGASAVVVIAEEGYPDAPKKGIKFRIPPNEGMVKVFHAGTKCIDEDLISTGGRILGISAVSPTLGYALQSCYGFINRMNIPNMYFRKDIGKRAT